MEFINFICSIKFLLLIWIICIIILYIKSDREYKISYNKKYFDVLPSNYTPAEMKILINYKKLSPQDIVATLINLIIKNAILVNKFTNENTSLKVKQNDYILTKNNQFDMSSLTYHEKFLIDWLINSIGNKEKVTLNSIKNYTRKIKSALNFNNEYITWCKEVNKTAEKNNFFKSNNISTFLGFLLSLIYFLFSIFLSLYFKRYTYLFLIIPACITCIYTMNILKLNPNAQQQYELWMAFKRYIRDLGTNELSCSIEQCEKYIPYSICLGVATQLISYIIEHFEEKDFNNENLTLFNKISPQELENLIKQTSKTFETSVKASATAKKIKD